MREIALLEGQVVGEGARVDGLLFSSVSCSGFLFEEKGGGKGGRMGKEKREVTRVRGQTANNQSQ